VCVCVCVAIFYGLELQKLRDHPCGLSIVHEVLSSANSRPGVSNP